MGDLDYNGPGEVRSDTRFDQDQRTQDEARIADLQRRLAETEADRERLRSFEHGWRQIEHATGRTEAMRSREDLTHYVPRLKARAEAAERERDEWRQEAVSSKPPRQWQEAVERAERERDELQSILATTTDKLNTALRENGLAEVGSDYATSFAIRDGVDRLFGKAGTYRSERDKARAEASTLHAAIYGENGWRDERDEARAEVEGLTQRVNDLKGDLADSNNIACDNEILQAQRDRALALLGIANDDSNGTSAWHAEATALLKEAE